MSGRVRGGRWAAAVAVAAGLLLGLARTGDARQAADTTSPTINGASDISVPATFDCGQTFCADVTFPFTVSDPDDPPDQIVVVCNNPNGQTYFWGLSMTTCQAHDPAGNHSAPVMFTVTVTLPPPTFQTVPGPLTFPATGPAGGPATFTTPPAVDVGGQSVPVTCDHQSGLVYAVGVTTITCTAQIQRNDSQGNPIQGLPSATTTFAVTITTAGGGPGGGGSSGGGGGSSGGGSGPGGSGGATGGGTTDTTAPAVDYSVLATDPDDGTARLQLSCTPASGSVFPLGRRRATRATTVTCHARDAAGNEAKPMTFTVTVLGAHDQLVALERRVRGARVPTAAGRASLLDDLHRADRACAAGAYGRATSALAAFVAQAERLPRSSRAAVVEAAARVIAVVG